MAKEVFFADGEAILFQLPRPRGIRGLVDGRRTDGRLDGWTDGQTDGWTDGPAQKKNMGKVIRIISDQKSSKLELSSVTFGHFKVYKKKSQVPKEPTMSKVHYNF